jgi:glycosyltransferase involved in cell wall biosynthesis
MKILIVAFWFPPSNVIGAIRVGKLARYLHRGGHDVRVLTTDTGEDRSLPIEIPLEHVVYTEFRSGAWLDWPVRFARGLWAATTGASTDAPQVAETAARRSSWDSIRRQYYGLIHIPDRRIGWLKTGLPAGRQLIKQWGPNIIFASAPPFTGLILARRLSREFNIPWVADFRDLWVDDPYYSEPAWRRPIDAVLERITVRNASALVTISPSLAEQLRRRHGKPTAVIYNGNSEEDFPPLPPGGEAGEVLIIRYTGTIYRGFRDPSPVFAAIGLLPSALRDRVMVEFRGDSCDDMLDLAAAHGIADRVAVKPRVPYHEALKLQMRADVLLLLQWNDARDEGNLPSKLFEYFYARRPILFIGYEGGIAAQMVRERQAGLVSNSPERIRNQLQEWIEDKRAGRLVALDPSVSRGLSRDEQFRKLEQVLADVGKGPVVINA